MNRFPNISVTFYRFDFWDFLSFISQFGDFFHPPLIFCDDITFVFTVSKMCNVSKAKAQVRVFSNQNEFSIVHNLHYLKESFS